MKSVFFNNHHNELIKVLEERLNLFDDSVETSFALVMSFALLPVYDTIPKETDTTYPVPVVFVIGKKTGETYTFAVKSLLPDVKL